MKKKFGYLNFVNYHPFARGLNHILHKAAMSQRPQSTKAFRSGEEYFDVRNIHFRGKYFPFKSRIRFHADYESFTT